jgi:hypothetical protein
MRARLLTHLTQRPGYRTAYTVPCVNERPPGNVCELGAHHREALLALVESDPIPAVHGAVRWRLKDLVQWLWDESGLR